MDPLGPVANARIESTMANDIRTVLKDFNRDLLTEELVASALPFESVFLAGFQRKGNSPFVGEPTPGPKLISNDKVNNIQDFADPGEIRFVFTTALTAPEATGLDTLLTNHDATQTTAEQDRSIQDETDLTILEAAWPNWATFTPTEKDEFLRRFARSYLRDQRRSSF